MFTDNRKEEMEITGSQIKGVEKELFTNVDTSVKNVEEIQENEDVSDINQSFYYNQSTYNLEGESLW
ncbi:MAG: hypothetical protein ACR2KZ_14990 [Segetibacter sp.]